MAYDDSIFRRRDGESSDMVGSAAYQSNRFADDEYAAPGYRDHDYDPAPAEVGHRTPPPALGDVFDDPEHGDPGRDRMGVHLGWELVLLLAAAGMAYLLYRLDPDILRRPALDPILVLGATVGLLALGAGLTLRAGVPNLAVGPVAVATALHFAENSDAGVVAAVGGAAAVAMAGGLLLALLVVGFHVPAWAASLAGALAVVVFIQLRQAPVDVQGGFDPEPRALYLFGGFAVLALLGGLLGTVKTIRRAIGRYRPVGDPAHRRGALAATLATLSLVFSSLLAVGAGALLAAGGDGPVEPTTGFEWTGLALGTAMLAGTSAFGRRGGVFGTLFAVVLVVLFLEYAEREDWDISLFAIAAGVLAAGLVVTRLVEAYGRPPVARPDVTEDWRPEAAAPAGVGRTAPEPWSSPLPVQPVDDAPGSWDDDRWGSPAR